MALVCSKWNSPGKNTGEGCHSFPKGSSRLRYRTRSPIFQAECLPSEPLAKPKMRPHRWQPIRLPHPWDSPGKNPGVGCHFLLQRMKVKSEGEVAQSCPTLSDSMDCSPPGSSIHGIFQARVLEWGAIAFSKKDLNDPDNHNGVITYLEPHILE